MEIVNINFAVWRDSTSLEAKVREIFQLPSTEESKYNFRDIKLFVNAGSFSTGAWQVCEDKLFHELHFDQLYAYLGASLLGYTILLNFLARLIVYSKHECVVLNL